MSFQTALDIKLHARHVEQVKRRWRILSRYAVRAAAMDDDIALRAFWCELQYVAGRGRHPHAR